MPLPWSKHCGMHCACRLECSLLSSLTATPFTPPHTSPHHCRYVEELVKSEMAAGVPSERVVVAGFSQGGAIALMMMRSQLKLAAVVGRSFYVCLARWCVVGRLGGCAAVLLECMHQVSGGVRVSS